VGVAVQGRSREFTLSASGSSALAALPVYRIDARDRPGIPSHLTIST
jgi:hypothetical protein